MPRVELVARTRRSSARAINWSRRSPANSDRFAHDGDLGVEGAADPVALLRRELGEQQMHARVVVQPTSSVRHRVAMFGTDLALPERVVQLRGMRERIGTALGQLRRPPRHPPSMAQHVNRRRRLTNRMQLRDAARQRGFELIGGPADHRDITQRRGHLGRAQRRDIPCLQLLETSPCCYALHGSERGFVLLS